MDLNFLSRLGLVSPGPGVVPANGSEFGAPDYAQPYASEPQAPPGPPVNLLEGIPGYGAASGPPAVNIAPSPEAPLAPSAMPNAANMLQNLNVGAPADAAPAAAAADTATRPARARSSVLDTIGRVADVLAKVGGADALYQPTLDARQDREISLGDHDRAVAMEKLKLTGAQDALGDAARGRLAQAVRGTQALLASNPQADISKIFPILAARAGVDPAQAQELGGQLAANPQLLDGLAGFDDSSDKYGGNVVYGKNANGDIVPFQMNLKGGRARAILPEGFTPVDPLKFVDTGNAQVGVDPRTGRTVTSLDKSADPNTVANNSTRRDIAAGNNRTQITIAGMPARAKPGTGTTGATAGAREAVGTTLTELEGIYGRLDKMGALVSPQRGAAGNVLSYLRASGPGQVVEGALGTEAQTLRDRVASIRPQLMQQLAKATGMTGKQLDSNADVKLFMQTVTNPQSSYQANQAAIAGLRRLLASAPNPSSGGNSGGGGNRSLPPRLGAPAKPAARPAPRPAPRKPAGKPTVSNW